jgi:hypothetical protein
MNFIIPVFLLGPARLLDFAVQAGRFYVEHSMYLYSITANVFSKVKHYQFKFHF